MKKTINTQKFRERGFNLVEIVVATGIISLSLVSIIATAGRSIAVSHRALNTYGAALELEEGTEAVRIIRDDAWSNIAGLSTGTLYYPAFDPITNTWSLSTTSSDGVFGIYTRSVTVSDIQRNEAGDIDPSGSVPDSGTRALAVSVAWKESTGQEVTKTATVYLSDIF